MMISKIAKDGLELFGNLCHVGKGKSLGQVKQTSGKALELKNITVEVGHTANGSEGQNFVFKFHIIQNILLKEIIIFKLFKNILCVIIFPLFKADKEYGGFKIFSQNGF